MWNGIPLEVVPVIFMMGLCMWIARELGKASQNKSIRELERRLAQAQQGEREQRGTADRVNGTVDELKRTLAEIPEIARRLSEARNLRDIPHRALDLIEEIFDPSYSVFYWCTGGALLVVSTRGSCDQKLGDRMVMGQGLVGWAAEKQLPVTPEEIRFESGVARGRNLSEGLPADGFSVCLPIVRGNRALGVMLVGPCRRNHVQALAIGRTIALMSSVAITSAYVLKEQEQLAQTDGLTGLLNKSRIVHFAKKAIAESGHRDRVSLFLFDIDHFKHFNDTNGHLPGDDLLRSLGELLKSCLREGEYVGRYGGEEFLLVLSGVEKHEAFGAAERIRTTIAEEPFLYAEQQPLGRISISGGVSTWPTDGPDVDSLIRCADESLYEAKRNGRNRVVAYHPPEIGPQEVELLEEVESPALEEREKALPRKD